MDFEKAKEMLAHAEAYCRPVGPISEMIPGGLTLEDAHAICEGNIEKRLQAGEKLVGFKVGFTNIPLREKMGLPDSTYGYVTDRMVFQSGAKLDLEKLIAAKIECEICFLLKRDLEGTQLTVEDVLSATEGVSASFEICDSRIKEWKCPYPDFFADNGFSCGVVLSGHWHPVKGVDLVSETVILSKEVQRLAEGRGETALGHPARAVSWLAGKLAARGRKLKAGQFIMTGTLTPLLPVEKGASYVADFSTLGRVSVTFS